MSRAAQPVFMLAASPRILNLWVAVTLVSSYDTDIVWYVVAKADQAI